MGDDDGCLVGNSESCGLGSDKRLVLSASNSPPPPPPRPPPSPPRPAGGMFEDIGYRAEGVMLVVLE
jgi:hypothetical protein